MKKIKRKIGLVLSRVKCLEQIYAVLVKLNYFLFHWKERIRMTHPGKEDREKIYYVIRSRGATEGLLSTWFYVLESVLWAEDHHYIPWVDFTNDLCQYHVERQINNSDNAWEYYFRQPTIMTKDELKRKKNVLLSGWGKSKYQIEQSELEGWDKEKVKCVADRIRIQPYIEQDVCRIWDEKFRGKKTLGVGVRGTDYSNLKPKGHYVQPSIDDIAEKIREFLDKYCIDQIYLVTEDYGYYEKLKDLFGDLIFSIDEDFIKDYNKKDYISSSFKNDPYERGLKYLIRILLFSRCEYIVSGKASGFLFSDLIREEASIDSFWFELGRY